MKNHCQQRSGQKEEEKKTALLAAKKSDKTKVHLKMKGILPAHLVKKSALSVTRRAPQHLEPLRQEGQKILEPLN